MSDINLLDVDLSDIDLDLLGTDIDSFSVNILPVKLYEKWIKERTLLKKKKNFTVILGYSRMAFAFVLSQFDKSAII